MKSYKIVYKHTCSYIVPVCLCMFLFVYQFEPTVMAVAVRTGPAGPASRARSTERLRQKASLHSLVGKLVLGRAEGLVSSQFAPRVAPKRATLGR